MAENQREPSQQQQADAAPDPDERAFTGHPDHPPATPDQSVEGNQELLRQGEEEGQE